MSTRPAILLQVRVKVKVRVRVRSTKPAMLWEKTT